MSVPIIEEVRKNILERVEKIRGRIGMLGESKEIPSLLRGQVQVGGGKILEKAMSRVDQVTARISQIRPNILPQVVERLKTYEPGKRVMQLLPGAPAALPPPSPPVSPPSPGVKPAAPETKSKILRG